MDYFNQESARLRFRKLTPADIPTWTTFFHNNDRLEFLGIEEGKNHEEVAAEWINSQFARYEEHGLGHLAVELKDTGELVGLGGILPRELEKKNLRLPTLCCLVIGERAMLPRWLYSSRHLVGQTLLVKDSFPLLRLKISTRLKWLGKMECGCFFVHSFWEWR